ncbi:hypothetical protein [Streptomyces sp. NPDC057623]|uniref:hypothetical protein n=1 Tax=Streptomyces sp. NPDC057623 TaxID=3346187 RepID=UPI003689137E
MSGASADYRGVPVTPGVAFSTERRATSAMGSRTFTLRTLDLDFELVGRTRLRRAGVNQRLYSLTHALSGDDLVPNVFLGEAWERARDFAPDPVTDVLKECFRYVDYRVEQVDPALVRFRLAAWEPHHAD